MHQASPWPLSEAYRRQKLVEPALDRARWQALQSLLRINDIYSVSEGRSQFIGYFSKNAALLISTAIAPHSDD